jgi:5,10-methylenetetrahydromethanopterin reductase
MPQRPAISVALPPSRDIVEHARVAADLGYERVFVFDSPSLYGDLWVAIARIAEAVPDIGLASGVAVTSMRHPVVTASAIATIEDLAPGRLRVYFGTGFTARNTMGKRGLKWSDLATYVRQVRGLLAGETVDVDGSACQLMYSPGFGPDRPIEVPIGLAPMGPKGFAVSEELADSVILTMPPTPEQRQWDDIAMLVMGSVLDPGEDHTSERVRAAVGPFYVTTFHGIWEFAPEAVAGMPGGTEWLERLASERPEGQRHLAVHEGHFVTVTDRDLPLLDAAGEGLLATGWTGTAAQVAERADAAGDAGITELAFVPAGPDIARELEAFAAAVRG